MLDAVGITPDAEWLAFSFADDASQASKDAVVAGLADEYPYAAIETADQFRDRVAGMVDKILAMVNAMVALAVVIALIGIGNTLALSVFERTRELGLVRAVGMTRRQVRRMVRFEAALVALFGATLGVGLGLLFGYGVVGALPATFVSTFSVPVPSILVVVLVAAGRRRRRRPAARPPGGTARRARRHLPLTHGVDTTCSGRVVTRARRTRGV